MGFNTTVLILNDCLHEIAEDKEFGKKLACAIMQITNRESIDVSAGCCGNAAKVIETHHADYDVYIKVGGNCGEVISPDLIKKRKKSRIIQNK